MDRVWPLEVLLERGFLPQSGPQVWALKLPVDPYNCPVSGAIGISATSAKGVLTLQSELPPHKRLPHCSIVFSLTLLQPLEIIIGASYCVQNCFPVYYILPRSPPTVCTELGLMRGIPSLLACSL